MSACGAEQSTSPSGDGPRRRSGEAVAREAILGGVSSAIACVFSNPVDIIRVRHQLTRRTGASQLAATSLNAGLGPAMAYNIVLNSTRFSLFCAVEDRVGPAAGGLMAGGIAGFLSSPLALWRTLRQAGAVSTAESVVQARPFAGALPWALRNAGHTACIFELFARTSRALEDSAAPLSPTLRHLAASLVAATTSCFLMNPLDVYCTRRFHDSLHTPPVVGSGSGTVIAGPAFRPSVPIGTAAAGTPSLRCLFAAGYRGLGANLLRTVPHTVLTFVFVGWMREPPVATLTAADALLAGLQRPFAAARERGRNGELLLGGSVHARRSLARSVST